MLRSSLPLMKARNSGVVLAVCELHYHCGVGSIQTREAIGKALVRIHRDKREIQFVVLQAIRDLAYPSPSMFTPYLKEFFIKATDGTSARLIKLEILTELAMNKESVDWVLREFRTYIKHDDKEFVKKTIQALGRIANTFSTTSYCDENVAINILQGLLTLISSSQHNSVIAEAVIVVRVIMSNAQFSTNRLSREDDLENVRRQAMRQLVFLLVENLVPDQVSREEGRRGKLAHF